MFGASSELASEMEFGFYFTGDSRLGEKAAASPGEEVKGKGKTRHLRRSSVA